jgi:carbon monoxide dehydrogenase subunit G
MADGKTDISTTASPDDAWKLIGDFGGLGDWMPGIDSCELEGDVRTLQMMGMTIKEQLRERDDSDRRIAYGIVESPMDNLEHHHATIWIDPEGDGSKISWSVEVKPDEMLPLFLPIYEGSLQEVKKKLEA